VNIKSRLADEQQNSKAAPLWHRIKSTRNNLAAYAVYADYAACVLSLGRTLTGLLAGEDGRRPTTDLIPFYASVYVRVCGGSLMSSR
jgi:hypothetical protein